MIRTVSENKEGWVKRNGFTDGKEKAAGKDRSDV